MDLIVGNNDEIAVGKNDGKNVSIIGAIVDSAEGTAALEDWAVKVKVGVILTVPWTSANPIIIVTVPEVGMVRVA